MTSSPAAFLANLRARHIINVAERMTFKDKIDALGREYESRLAELQIEASAADAAFQTSAGILEDAEAAFGPAEDIEAAKAADTAPSGLTVGDSAPEPAGRAKRGEIGVLILSTLREVPIAGMTEDQIIGALPQHKPGSVSAALKNAVKKQDIEEKDGRFFSAVDAAAERAKQPAAGQTNGSATPQPIAQPANPLPSPALGEPSPLVSQLIINAIKAGPKTYDELMDRCIALGGDADSSKATLEDLAARRVVEMSSDGRYDFVLNVVGAAS